MKMVLKGKTVLGVSIVGKNAGELLLPFTQTISGKSFPALVIISYPTREISRRRPSAREPTVFGSLPKKYAGFLAKMRRTFA